VTDVIHVETVAGILEPGDTGESGIARRAAIELAEEVGLVVRPEQIEPLGLPVFLSPGLMGERIYFCAVEIEVGEIGRSPAPHRGDGSIHEEGGEVLVLTMSDALARCESGVIGDAKTELALRRLESVLAQ
jgi:8-oxo-dGTP pyrophosphatase MutT (NUDIX family)